MVVYDQNLVIKEFTRSAERMFGYRASNLAHKLDHRTLHVDDSLKLLAEKAGGFGVADTEAFVKLKNHEKLHVKITAKLDDEKNVYCLYQDFSDVQRLSEQLEDLRDRIRSDMQQSEKEAEFLRELLLHTNETVQIAIAAAELHSGMIAYVNDSFEKLTGLDRMEVFSQTFDQVFKEFPETCGYLCGYTEKVRKYATESGPNPGKGRWEVEFRTGRKSIEVYGRPIVVEGHDNQYMLILIEDYTDRQRLQMQLVQSEKLAAIGQLAAGVAHEIRNPIATIFNALYDLKDILEDPTEEVLDDLNIATEEVQRVQAIITNMLDFARDSENQSGKTELTDALRKTMRLVQHDLQNKRINVDLDLEEMVEVQITNNSLKQILINLITNAAQAMPEGGTLSIKTQTKSGQVARKQVADSAIANAGFSPGEKDLRHSEDLLDLSSTNDPEVDDYTMHAVIEISDTGVGIPSKVLPNVFNPFFTTKAPGSGTGLGLSVVHSLIHEAGGAISVTSQVGHGTTFTIELPCVPDDND